MITFFMIIYMSSITFYGLVIMGKIVLALDEEPHRHSNIFIELASLILIIIVGLIPIMNIMVGSYFLYDEIGDL